MRCFWCRAGVGKLFTRRTTFKNILKPRAVAYGLEEQKRCIRPQKPYFPLKISEEQKNNKKGCDSRLIQGRSLYLPEAEVSFV